MMLGHCYAYQNPSTNPRRVVPFDDENTQDKKYGQMNGRERWSDDPNAFRYGNLYAELGSSFHFDAEEVLTDVTLLQKNSFLLDSKSFSYIED